MKGKLVKLCRCQNPYHTLIQQEQNEMFTSIFTLISLKFCFWIIFGFRQRWVLEWMETVLFPKIFAWVKIDSPYLRIFCHSIHIINTQIRSILGKASSVWKKKANVPNPFNRHPTQGIQGWGYFREQCDLNFGT